MQGRLAGDRVACGIGDDDARRSTAGDDGRGQVLSHRASRRGGHVWRKRWRIYAAVFPVWIALGNDEG